MTVSDVAARIAQIQSQLALLAPSSAPGSAAAFAGQLDAAGRTATSAAVSGSTGGVTGADVVASARKYLGVPYVWGGTDPQKGLDCSGLVQRAFADLGIDLPRVSYQQAAAGTRIEGGLANAQPGDVLAFGSPVHHVGIYLGNNQMIEAPRPGLDVRITDVYETPTHIRRFTGTGGVGGVGDTGVARVGSVVIGGAGGAVSGVPYAELFNRAGATYGVDPTLLAAVARQESGFDASAVSPAGPRGLMQLMPATAQGLGVSDSFDPGQSVDGAARLLRDLLDRFGRVDLALAGYNAGPGAVLRYDGVPPYPETQNYVRSILSMVRSAA